MTTSDDAAARARAVVIGYERGETRGSDQLEAAIAAAISGAVTDSWLEAVYDLHYCDAKSVGGPDCFDPATHHSVIGPALYHVCDAHTALEPFREWTELSYARHIRSLGDET